MTNPFPSLYGQMTFTILVGSVLLLIPNIIFDVLGIAPTAEPWVRILGLLVLALSIYYYFIARHGNPPIAKATVYTRLFFCIGLILFVSMRFVPITLILLPLTELGLTFWTWREISKIQ